MKNLISIIELITKPKAASSAELRTALSEIAQADYEGLVGQLEAQRRKLLVYGTDQELQAQQRELDAANLAWERSAAAAEELKNLIANAEELEKAATIDTTAATARRLQRELLEQMVAFDEVAARLAEMRQGLEGTMRQLEAANTYLAEHGHGDLRQPTPNRMLAAQGVSQDDMPRLSDWFMPGYYPLPQGWSPRPAARPFALAKKLLQELS